VIPLSRVPIDGREGGSLSTPTAREPTTGVLQGEQSFFRDIDHSHLLAPAGYGSRCEYRCGTNGTNSGGN
jgi:hypothetical protein